MTANFAVYLHVPFCARQCDYCAFATWTDRGHLQQRYMDACKTQLRADLADAAEVSTVFVGGGTPTLVAPNVLMDVLAEIPLAVGAEVTVECNPDDVTDELFATFAAGGVTRVSVGVQSMVPEVLESLGRSHEPSNVHRAAKAAERAGLDLSLDLIYGAAGETQAQWRHTLSEAIRLEPHHISAYALTVEPGTPLAKNKAAHPDDDDQADKYLMTTELLDEAGFQWYEISNWARPGHRCRHNLIYWLGGDYLPVGCAAHGYVAGRRFWHVRTPERYIRAIEEGTDPVAAGETLDDEERQVERLQLLVRTGVGIPEGALSVEDLDGPLRGLVERVDDVGDDWGIDVDGPRLVLTRKGRLLANEVEIRVQVPPGAAGSSAGVAG